MIFVRRNALPFGSKPSQSPSDRKRTGNDFSYRPLKDNFDGSAATALIALAIVSALQRGIVTLFLVGLS